MQVNFKAQLKIFRERKRISKTDLANRINVSLAYISHLESGRDLPPTLERCRQIASALELSPEESKRFIDSAMEERLDSDQLIWIEEKKKGESVPIKEVRIPVVGWAKGGAGTIDVEPAELFPQQYVEFKNCKSIVVRGDSMSPVAYAGQKIIYMETKIINDGDLVYVGLKDGNEYIKRYHKDKKNGLIMLQPINIINHHAPFNIKEKDIKFIHKVVGVSYI